MIFFTSDLHLGHENCIRLCNRPFSSIEEMDEILIENWNHKVTGKDTVYILGDLIYRSQKPPEEYLRRLRGYPRRPDLPQPKAAGGIPAAAAGEETSHPWES